MFNKLLIANRGEIACRILKTAKKLNISTVAVFSAIDRHALHVEMADEAYLLGPAPSIESYLNLDKILTIAKQTKVDAIHPGYGFLSEDPEFATACAQAGITFIGPSAQAIKTMGDKTLAKSTMLAAGVPVIPGYHADDLNLSTLTEAAEKIGLPILVKASAGGGGKGMRLVEKLEQLAEAVASARREAQASFGDSRIFLEKYLDKSRHIEVQILFDQFGQGVYLFDRDCSIQRRHQKIIEEAPAPFLNDSTRQKMAATALKAGIAIQYQGVGTIEFLVDEQQNYYFMEMNTRLQVEHPVTEMITGLDLVEWQLRVAAGEKLDLQLSNVVSHGHSLEARLYAENPQQNFMPSSGALDYYRFPPFPLSTMAPCLSPALGRANARNEGGALRAASPCDPPWRKEISIQQQPGIRVDTGFRQGDMISVYYDPLIAKLIVWAQDRPAAVEKLQQCLMQTAVAGIHTNLTLLNRIAHHPQFIAGKIVTQFIPEEQHILLSEPSSPPDIVIGLACLAVIRQQQSLAQSLQQQSDDHFSPWLVPDGWRLNGKAQNQILLWQEKNQLQILVEVCDHQFRFSWNHHVVNISSDHPYQVFIKNQHLIVFHLGEQWQFSLQNPAFSEQNISDEFQVRSPMPGTLVAVYVKPGQKVLAGEKLLVMEAMKMEHTLLAPREAIIKAVLFQPGDRINEGTEIITFE